MATYGSKKFEEQCIRVYIKQHFCIMGNACSLAIHPEKNASLPKHRICSTCNRAFESSYREVKQAMEHEQTRYVTGLIKASCRIGACKTSSYDCGVCGPREKNMRQTTKECYQYQKKACDAYLLRVYSVPRNGFGYEHRDLKDSRSDFWTNWRPFVSPDGKFECNYPALFLRMQKEDAPELNLVSLPYTVIPKVENDDSNSRFSVYFKEMRNKADETAEEASTLVANTISSTKDIMQRTFNRIGDKTAELMRKGSEKVKSSEEYNGLRSRVSSLKDKSKRRFSQMG